MLGEKISVSNVRKKEFVLKVDKEFFWSYAVYYPIGNGIFNQEKAVEDVTYILNNK